MEQDWSSPFTMDLLDSIKDCCVYCATAEDWNILRGMITAARRVRVGRVQNFDLPYPCLRFSGGKTDAIARGSVGFYERDYAALPKFTFYGISAELPDINIPDGSVSMF